MTNKYLDRTIDFLRQHLNVKVQNPITELQVWENIALQNGTIVLTKDCDISDLLHEAGHLATCPSEIRSILSGDVGICLANYLSANKDQELDRRWMYFNDLTAIAWQYLVGRELAIPPELILGRDFEKDIQTYILQFETLKKLNPYLLNLMYAGFINSVEQHSLSHYLQI